MSPTRDELDRARTMAVLERWVARHGRLPREDELPETSRAQIEAHFGSWKRARQHVIRARALHYG
jgi:hypothetical protein